MNGRCAGLLIAGFVLQIWPEDKPEVKPSNSLRVDSLAELRPGADIDIVGDRFATRPVRSTRSNARAFVGSGATPRDIACTSS